MPPTRLEEKRADECIVCRNHKILKDQKPEILTKIVEFYWEVMDIDIQLQSSESELHCHNLCKDCFVPLIELYDLKEMIKTMEVRYGKNQKVLVGISLDAIQQFQENGKALKKIQKQMLKEWGKDDIKIENENNEEDIKILHTIKVEVDKDKPSIKIEAE